MNPSLIAPIARCVAGEAFDFPPSPGCGPHRLMLHVPDGPPPAAGWPLLLATDGNATFDLALAMMRTQAIDRTGSNVVEGIIAAIGYPTNGLYDDVGRSWDLAPPPGRGYEGADGGEIRTGGAEHFLAFVETTLLPWLAARAPIDPRRKTLFGHSFGGLFTLFALYRRPGLFSTYAAACPSLYWEDETIKPFEDAFFAAPPDLPGVSVLLSAGQWEGAELAPHLRGRPGEAALRERLAMIAKVDRAAALLRRFQDRHPALDVSLEVFPGENHMSALAVAMNRAIQAAFAIPV